MKNYLLRIAWLYPDLMSTYGDRGNVIVLTKRCQWRGIGVKIIPITFETLDVQLSDCNLIFMGGGQDRQQKLLAKDFLTHKVPVIKTMIDSGTPGLFVCGAYQFMGHYYQPYQGDRIPGAGIFDLYTVHPGDQAKRLIGNATAEVLYPEEFARTVIVGFENHGGRTYLGNAVLPLAKVQKGYGNNGEDGFEGAVYNNAIGTYMHGPLLPKNPLLADWLIRLALEKKYGRPILLSNLDESLEHDARRHAIRL